jgi:predicted DNA-binding protein
MSARRLQRPYRPEGGDEAQTWREADLPSRTCITFVIHWAQMPTSISSVRISDELRGRLERTARYLKKGKSWVINQALDEYLRKVDRDTLAVEARRQSLLASSVEAKEHNEFWEKAPDTRGWR